MTMYRNLRTLLAVLAFALACAPQAATSQEASPSAAQAQAAAAKPSQGYVLGALDVIHVEALNHPDFNVKVQIGSDGTVQLPYIGTISAANMTVAELRNRIAAELTKKGVFSNVSITADIVSYASRYATVLGGVVTPGLVPLDREYHLSEVLARAGGVREGGSNYVIIRSPDGNERKFSVGDLATGSAISDPIINPGDKIYVPNEVFYIKGQVKSPGAYPLSLNMTLAMALARGGGLTEMGSDSHITVLRKNTELKPDDLNFKVQPDDVIDVGEGWF
jgi:polysaccharide export outer membrane protein